MGGERWKKSLGRAMSQAAKCRAQTCFIVTRLSEASGPGARFRLGFSNERSIRRAESERLQPPPPPRWLISKIIFFLILHARSIDQPGRAGWLAAGGRVQAPSQPDGCFSFAAKLSSQRVGRDDNNKSSSARVSRAPRRPLPRVFVSQDITILIWKGGEAPVWGRALSSNSCSTRQALASSGPSGGTTSSSARVSGLQLEAS